ncbi:hypothetical protein LB518_00020 [Mesorhizobium sp. BR1-1-16]|uniref:hypothetical protein n=1 Tax=Mesorhizobium sp. BR1-1-16 TaxID=2876653 RepID=UPI001CCF9BC6|nr:hypothetical protein [Mesorhizobium sp. BR1-1-16]MBZ9934663.1 hypothetical protein [Mesorhizobium sp. BR1-1-16]
MALKAKPRIGILAVGLAAYWPQFPGMRDAILGHHARLLDIIGPAAERIEIGLVDTIDGARAAAARLAAADVDAVFVHLTTYATSEPLLIAVAELDVPIVLLNVQSVRKLDMAEVHGIGDWLGVAISCAALPEMTASLRRIGKRFDVVTGHLEGDAALASELSSWLDAASIRRTLRTKSFGLFGRPYPGMTDLSIDETAFFAAFGAYTKHLNWDDIAKAATDVSEDDAEARLPALRAAFAIPKDVEGAPLGAIARVLAGLDRLIAREALCALPNHYEGAVRADHEAVLAASNPAFSVLMAEGIACPVEADIKTALAMLMLKAVAGTATLAELYSMDFNDDVVILGHSGAADVTISAEKPTLKHSSVFHGKTGSGFLTQTYPKLGPMTLLSLTQNGDGRFVMVVAEGEIVGGPPMMLGDTNCRVRFPLGLRGFIKAWAAEGPTHHGVMAPGVHAAALERVATLFAVPLRRVC